MRSVLRTLALAAAIAVADLAIVTAGVSPASADPPPGVVPAATDIVSVGAATTQAYDNGLSAAYNATSPTQKYYSWNATPSGVVTTKSGAVGINRPDGSGQGLNALGATTNATIDVARTSRDQVFGSAAWFIPFAHDAVGWSAYTGGNAPHDLTSADLQSIYNCTFTKWSDITDEPGYHGRPTLIKVYVPQPGSGTRTNFLHALGITASSEPCWQFVALEEDEGTAAAFTGNPDAIFPYSLGHYVGQRYRGKGSGSDQPGVLDALRSIDGIEQIDTAGQQWNPNLDLTYIFNLYHVVRQSDWATNPGLKLLFGRAANGGWVCTNAATAGRGNLVTDFGYQPLTPARACGTPSAGALSGY